MFFINVNETGLKSEKDVSAMKQISNELKQKSKLFTSKTTVSNQRNGNTEIQLILHYQIPQ